MSNIAPDVSPPLNLITKLPLDDVIVVGTPSTKNSPIQRIGDVPGVPVSLYKATNRPVILELGIVMVFAEKQIYR